MYRLYRAYVNHTKEQLCRIPKRHVNRTRVRISLMIYVALLRGINVGGNTMVRMADLRGCFTQLGFSDVATYINSGNVIFSSNTHNARTLEKRIETALATAFHLPLRVVVRSRNDIASLIDHLPESWSHAGDKKCNVIFLHTSIDTPTIVQNFKPKPGIEELYYHPGVLFWSADTGALTRSAMIGVSKSNLYKQMTVRNLNTVRKIYELMQA